MNAPMKTSTALQTPAQPRRVARIIQALSTIEGGGFPVRRPFPIANFSHFDPFLLIDHLGPVRWDPGAALGAPDHPHRGFETVTYVLAGENEHRDSFGNADVLRPGDVQWMTAGGGVIHSEMPTARFQREGGVQEGFQIWVNLPAVDKMMTPRYQTLRADDIPTASSEDGRVAVRVIAGESLGRAAANSLCFGLYHGTTQVGFARVITDLATYGYLSDVVIDQSCRGQGLGKWLIECILAHPDLQHLRRLALLTRDSPDLYAGFGFVPGPGARNYMELLGGASAMKRRTD